MLINNQLISLEQAKEIVANNQVFYSASHEIDECTLHIFNYRLAKESDFFKPVDSKNYNGFEMRGLMFLTHSGGSVKRFLRLPKFFNLNQCESTQYEKIKDKKIVSVTKKMDGSMVSFIKVKDKVMACTKMGPATDVALAAQKLYESYPDEFKEYISDSIDFGNSIIFEFLDANVPIVIVHKESKFVPLWMRDVNGDLKCPEEIPGCARELEVSTDIAMVTNGDYLVIDDVIAKVKEMDASGVQEEGFVVMFEDGQMVKVKTEWYLTWHNFKTNDIFYADLAIAKIINEQTDDWLACLDQGDPRKEKIELMIAKVSAVSKYLENVMNVTHSYCQELREKHHLDSPAIKKRVWGSITALMKLEVGLFSKDSAMLSAMAVKALAFASSRYSAKETNFDSPIAVEERVKFIETIILKETYKLKKAEKFLEEAEVLLNAKR